MIGHCANCGKEVGGIGDVGSILFDGKCWDCAMGHNTPAGAVKRLRLALDTLKMYPQCQFQEGQDGYAAMAILGEHIAKLEAIVEPRLEFKDLKPGAIFQFSDHGTFPASLTENLWLKLSHRNPVGGCNSVEMGTGILGYIGPDTYVRLAGIPTTGMPVQFPYSS